MKPLVVIEAPSNLGLKEPEPGKEPGVKKLPDWLKDHGFYQKISPEKIIRLEAPTYSMKLDKESDVRNAEEIVFYSKQLSAEIGKVLNTKRFPFTVGGDCSILVGCAHGLKSNGKYGLFFIDGHTDFILPDLSRTKALAGMDLAVVTGYGHSKLTDIDGLKPYIKENHVLAFGNRYYMKEYVEVIKNSSVLYYDLSTIRKEGIEQIVNIFLARMEFEVVDGFWIHIDADVLNDDIMPCVDSRQPDGLSYDELRLTLTLLLKSELAAGIDITILNPELDSSGIYTKAFVNELSACFMHEFSDK
jgi:arginase